jgi:ribonuclease T1
MNLRWMKTFGVARVQLSFALAVASCLALAGTPAFAYSHRSATVPAVQEIAVSALPPEAKETLRLLKQGGPFPYPRDGTVFGNFEKRLPKKQRGYYHEYTVKTPGMRSRGARRIVCGQIFECYYSDDHYETFKLIRE